MDFRTNSGSVSAHRFGLRTGDAPLDEDFITLEIEEESCGRLQFDLPSDITDEEIAYIKSRVPRAESGLLELLDPDTGEVVFSCTPVLVH